MKESLKAIIDAAVQKELERIQRRISKRNSQVAKLQAAAMTPQERKHRASRAARLRWEQVRAEKAAAEKAAAAKK